MFRYFNAPVQLVINNRYKFSESAPVRMLSVRVWLRKSALMHALQQMMTAEFCLFIIRQEICRRGGAWFASFGRTRNTGTKVRTYLVTSCFT